MTFFSEKYRITLLKFVTYKTQCFVDILCNFDEIQYGHCAMAAILKKLSCHY